MDFFNRFTLETPESVELDFTLAGIGNRVYAAVIDLIVSGLILIGVLILGYLGFYIISDQLQSFGIPVAQIGLWILAIQFFIIFAIYVGYFVFFETLWQGRTPGKRWAKIRVIQDNGKPIQLPQATLRSLLRPIDDTFFLGVFLIIFGKREKRIGDWVAGTIVIQEEESFAKADFSLSQEAETLADQLEKEADLSQLLPDDFAKIREYLRRREKMAYRSRIELARKLAYSVKDMIRLEEIPEGVTATVFLEAIYLAYQRSMTR